MTQPKPSDGIDRPSNQNGPSPLGRAWIRGCSLALTLSAAACAGGDAASAVEHVEMMDGLQITLADGEIHGAADRATRSFIGIPYAAPPTDSLRWKAPQPPQQWEGVLDATGPGVACFQAPNDADVNLEVPQTEDCLQLNVFAPEHSREPLPVFVWLHGGDNLRGSANEFQPSTGRRLYDGASLRQFAQEDVVVVTLNYRLGALGFLAHPALTDEAGSSGNYGLMDQQAALRWVQRNIRAFGGDPKRVTLAGQGAGAADACDQLIASGASGLVHAVVFESGTCGTNALPSLQSAHARGVATATELGCTDADAADALTCLRALPPAELVASKTYAVKAPSSDIFAIVDGVWLHEQPRASLETGRFEDVPIIAGTNADEGSYFVKRGAALQQEADYRAWLAEVFGAESVSAIENQYPAIEAKDLPYGLGYTYPDVLNLIAARVVSDAFFVCPAQRFADAMSRFTDVYRYEFIRKPYIDPYIGLGATHGAEVLWVWDVFPFVSPYATDDVGLSAQIGGYWSRLVNGSPNREGGPHEGEASWPRYDATNRSEIIFDLDMTTANGRDPAQCEFWKTRK
jgi:para-nitrobenzyl esterase